MTNSFQTSKVYFAEVYFLYLLSFVNIFWHDLHDLYSQFSEKLGWIVYFDPSNGFKHDSTKWKIMSLLNQIIGWTPSLMIPFKVIDPVQMIKLPN